MKSMDLENPAKESAEPPPAAGAAQVRADSVDGRREDSRDSENSYTAEDVLRANLEQQRAAARAGL